MYVNVCVRAYVCVCDLCGRVWVCLYVYVCVVFFFCVWEEEEKMDFPVTSHFPREFRTQTFSFKA